MANLVLAALAVGTLALGASAAEDPRHPLCRLFLHEDQREREDLELELTLARSKLAAHEEIFVLFDGLWKIQGIERLVYLRGKHDRDLAQIEVERLRLLVERTDAYLAQYRTYCDALSAGARPTDAQAGSIARAWSRYLGAECDALGQERSAAEVDLAYEREVLASVLELRAGDVATRPDVILAELEVRAAEERSSHARARVERCRAVAPAAPVPSPPPR